MWVKAESNTHEKVLLSRAEKYISYVTWIPGLRMVAVVNSLSMYATHRDSDIDLFIITAKDSMWIVRVLITLSFASLWVWRKWEDRAGNFCLSFFIEESAMDLSKIAIEDDIYLSFWIHYMKPIYVVGDVYERFIEQNDESRMNHDESTKSNHKKYTYSKSISLSPIFSILNSIFRYFWEKKARTSYEKKWRPEWVTVTSDMLKFHDMDRRREIRDILL